MLAKTKTKCDVNQLKCYFFSSLGASVFDLPSVAEAVREHCYLWSHCVKTTNWVLFCDHQFSNVQHWRLPCFNTLDPVLQLINKLMPVCYWLHICRTEVLQGQLMLNGQHLDRCMTSFVCERKTSFLPSPCLMVMLCHFEDRLSPRLI